MIVDGESRKPHDIESEFHYTTTRRLPIGKKREPLDVQEAEKLLKALELFSWEKRGSALLLAGWVAQARLSGALPIRPHVWLTGPKASGKSTVLKFVMTCLGSSKGYLKVQGGTTAAGIRQSLQADSIPVVYDEFEVLEGNHELERIMGLFRQSWSYTDARIVKGTADGVAHSFCTNFSALVGGIRVHFPNDADRSRFTVLELKAHDSDLAQQRRIEDYLAGFDKEWGERLFLRSIKMIPVIKESAKILQSMITSKINQRFGAQLGALLAAGYSLLSDNVIPKSEAELALQEVDFEDEAVEVCEKDEEHCLDWLLTKRIRVGGGSEAREKTIRRIIHDGNDYELKELQSYGLRYSVEGNLAVAYRHTELQRLYQGTRWKSWARSLRRLPDSEATATRLDGNLVRCIRFPLKRADA